MHVFSLHLHTLMNKSFYNIRNKFRLRPYSMLPDRVLKLNIGWLVAIFSLFTAVIFTIVAYIWPGDKTIYDIFSYAVNPPSPSGYGRWGGFAIIVMYLLASLLISGLIITMMVNYVDLRRDNWLKGNAKYNLRSNFCLIIGGHRMVPNICKKILERKDAPGYIVIQCMKPAEILRNEIESVIGDDKMQRIVIYHGNRTSATDIADLNPWGSNSIYLIGENSAIDGKNHDVKQIRTLQILDTTISASKGKREGRIPCHVMFEYQSTFTVFQYTDPYLMNIRFIPFNFYETWAQQVIIRNETDAIRYKPLDADAPDTIGITPDSDTRVHLIIIGMSKMGIALAIEAALSAHYPNFITKGVHPLITFIDINADCEMNYFKGRFHNLFEVSRWRYVEAKYNPERPADVAQIFQPDGSALFDGYAHGSYADADLGRNITDIDWEFIKGDIASPPIKRYIADACIHDRTTIAICLPSHQAISAALYMPDSVYTGTGAAHQILVQQDYDSALIEAISSENDAEMHKKYTRLKPFGMIDKCDYDDLTLDLASRLILCAYDVSLAGSLQQVFRTDIDLEAWLREMDFKWNSITPDKGKSAISQKWSNIYNGMTIPAKVRSFFHRETFDSDLAAQVEHVRWNTEQLILGFRTPSAAERSQYRQLADSGDKDALNAYEKALRRNMVHPHIVSYEKLSANTRQYDIGITRHLYAMNDAINRFHEQKSTKQCK